MKKQRLLVVGASGFVGKNLVLRHTQDADVSILVRTTSKVDPFRNNPRIKVHYGDLEKNEGIAASLEGIDTVIHCAARTMGRSYWEFHDTNIQGTDHLVNAMLEKKVQKILYVSSHAACGPCSADSPLQECDRKGPISFYGRSKNLAEELIKTSGLNYTIVRPVSVYGPYDKEILTYVKILNRGLCPVVGPGPKNLNLIYVIDLVDIILRIVKENHFPNKVYFINDGQCYTMDYILDTIAKTLGKKPMKITVPTSLALFVGLLNDVFIPPDKKLVTRDKVRELSCQNWLCSSDNISRELGFKPRYTFEQGIAETIKWYKNQGCLG